MNVRILPAVAAVVFWLLLLATPAIAADQLTARDRQLLGFDGKPLTLTGDSPWSLMVKVDLNDARAYLEARRRQGFNAVLVNLIEHYFGGPPNTQGEAPFNGRAFVAMNEAYFTRAHQVVALARELGFIVFLTPAYVGYECGSQGWCAEMKAASDAEIGAYGRYVGERFADLPNIVWVNGGDVDVRRFGLERKVAALATGLRRSSSQLHTAHCARDFSALDCYSFLKLDLDAAYGGCPTVPDVARHSAKDSQLPFVLIEGRYENEGASVECVRRQAFGALLGGAIGHFYGEHTVQFFNAGWRSLMNTPGAYAAVGAARVLAQLHLTGTTPDSTWPFSPGIMLDGDWLRSQSVTGISDGRLAAFVGSSRQVRVREPAGAEDRPVLWYDLDHGRSHLDASRVRSLGLRTLAPPYGGSWLLVVPAPAS